MFDLKRFREDFKIKQSDLCDLFDCKQPYISALEKGSRTLSEDKYNLLQQKYGDISDYIINNIDNNIDQVDSISEIQTMIPYEFVKSLLDERKRVDEERKRVDEERIRHDEQVNRLITIIENKKVIAHQESNAGCAAATGSDK